jgi:hypothetical protein
MAKSRDYKSEYQNYHASPEQRAKNNSRKRARYALEKGGVVSKGDGKDVDHKDGNPLNNKRSNLRVTTKTANRSFPRNKKAGKK